MEYDDKMIHKYKENIQDGDLSIGELERGDSEITNLRFLEQFNIQTLTLFISNQLSVKFRNYMIKELSIWNLDKYQKLINVLQVDDLELENLEVLKLEDNNLENNQLYNLVKFKKLHSLNVSKNKVDLTHIHCVTSITELSMGGCGLKNIDQLQSLINLEDLDLSSNILENQQLKNLFTFNKLHSLNVSKNKVDLTHIHKVTSLTKLTMQTCYLSNIDQITSLVNLEKLVLSFNQNVLFKHNNITESVKKCGLNNIDQISSLANLKDLDLSGNNIDISPLYQVNSLTKLSIVSCGLKNIDQVAPLTNLEVLYISCNHLQTIDSIRQLVNIKELDISWNSNINISPLKDVVSLIKLSVHGCELTQLSALKHLVNLQFLDISCNYNIIITELQHLTNLTVLNTVVGPRNAFLNQEEE
ncbi:leucine-rich_repeat domain-containing protein [Hexamita inflata]|uniref:Leucine-rich repeat domain-containing protein n=1 Tax=Hexamita inflata TaxID=28002 RepID=A0AA86UYA1_9EUKA|nr:leucine-rich repeat domain-containing protein [Hexamita inflata]